MLILTPTKQVVIARAGAIEPLVALLREGYPVAQGEATLALYYIAFGNPDSQLAIAQAGAIEPLVGALLRPLLTNPSPIALVLTLT